MANSDGLAASNTPDQIITTGQFEFGSLDVAVDRLKNKSSYDLCLLQGQQNYLVHHREAAETIGKKPSATQNDIKDLERRIQQEVRALIARWLRMQNVCVLAGAGTSLKCGGPLGTHLADKVSELLAGRSSAALFKKLRTVCHNHLNFEAFLSHLGAIRRCLDPSVGTFNNALTVALPAPSKGKLKLEQLDSLLRDIEAALGVLCNLRLISEDDPWSLPHLQFIGKLLSRDPTLGRIKLATTNYDTLFEQAMDRLGVLYADGFTGTVERHFNPGSFGLDYYYPGEVGEGRVRRYDKFLHLYKLHGSIRWRRSPHSDEDPYSITYCGKALPTAENIADGSGSLDEFFMRNCSPLCQADLGLAILPTSSKYGESIAMPYAHLFRAFAEALQEPQTVCLVVGYSGWDQHVNRVIQDALTNPSFTLVIVDPIITEWTQRLLKSDRCERVYSFSGVYGTFERFSDLMPDVEQLKTQAEVARQQREMSSGSAAFSMGDGGGKQ